MFINWEPKLHFDPNSLNLSATHGIPLPTYGNYGGPGYTGGTVGGTITGTSEDPLPVDDLDKLFYTHDLSYQNATTTEELVAADVLLLKNMADLNYTNNPEARLYEGFATLGIAGNDLADPDRFKVLTKADISTIAGAIPSAVMNLEAGLAEVPSEAKSLHGAFNVFEHKYLPSLGALLGSASGSSELNLVTGEQDVATDTSKLVQAMASFGASGPALDTSMVTGSHNEPGQQAMLAVHGHHG